ncbi:MAG: SDR family oxidoreductase [Candidatus Rokuibacteriota bacterium]
MNVEVQRRFGFRTSWLQGRVAVVTGAARGIGYVIAERLARDGASVVLGDIEGSGLETARDAIARAGGRAAEMAFGDLAKQEAAEALVAAALARFGAVDLLVNNAGGGVIRPFLSHTPETLRLTIDRNLWTAIWCCRAALPHMVARKYGRIVNIGADSVRSGLWDHAAYNAAKGGMPGLTTGLAREFASSGITVNTVAPCATRTPQMAEIEAKDKRLAEKFVSIIPLGRPAEMAEIASMVSYLGSEEAAFVTGQVLSVNGGSTML